MSERSTFSPFWHRVRAMKPRLRPHVQITRQHFRGRRWHVVHDPSSNQFYRLNSVAHEFVGLLDGRRTVEAVWQTSLEKHADDALTQNEVIQLLSQLYGSNLLTGDVTPETEQLLRRGRDRTAKKVRQQAIGLMYFKVRLFNPDTILSWLEPIVRPAISPVGFLLWLGLVVAAVVALLPHWGRLASGIDGAIAPANWGWMAVVFVLLKLFHELGHGLICKRYGGQVPEFGAMLLVLLPAPYVDASAAWGFTSKWKRIAVGAGGMLFELFVAAIAAFVWLRTPDESLPHQLAYNVMLSAGVSTVLFNANPLMKFDGYYMLSDLLEVPNLMQRSNQMLQFLFQRHVYRLEQAQPPTGSLSEAAILVVYGIAAFVYRIFLFVSITLYVMTKLFAIGVFLAAWTAAMWFILPTGRFVHWLATSPMLSDSRPRAIATSVALAALVVTAVGVIPAPDRRRASGVLESASASGVFFGVDGFVREAHVRGGDRVEQGQPLVTLENASLDAHYRLSKAQLAEVESRGRAAMPESIAAAQAAEEYARAIRAQLEWLEARREAMIVRAPHAGVVVGDDPRLLLGSYVREGAALCEVVDLADVRVAAVLSQTEASWVREGPLKVEVRTVSRVDDVVPARTEKIIEAGTRSLPHEALSAMGGGVIATSPDDQTGRVATSPVFRGYFRAVDDAGAERAAPIGVPGERVVLRFTLESRPLAAQWWVRLRQALQGRAKI
ncbi:MAG: PqqD family peptide modification chaperone [Planctomycetota bacterium]|nr:PqqD family peptide modification chaperone [Planctomycetota bacterium]